MQLGAAAGAAVGIVLLTTALPAPSVIPSTLPAAGSAGPAAPATATTAPGAPAPGTSAASSAAAPSPAGGGLRILAAGDSVGFTFAYYWPLADTPGVVMDGTAALGCRLQDGVVLEDGKEAFPTNGCPDWRTTWPAKLASFQPDVVVLFATEWEVFDSRVDGHDVAFGSDESDAAVRRYLADLRR